MAKGGTKKIRTKPRHVFNLPDTSDGQEIHWLLWLYVALMVAFVATLALTGLTLVRSL